ncbi:MAG: histone deacetylase family protein [Candidatus Thorarchaeota archaeon]|nr:MAG: histone deacetylase family protein [Candidatus Thorarchaeota archaeon]
MLQLLNVKVVTHTKMKESYDGTPAGAPGRLDSAFKTLESYSHYEVIEARPATREEILRAHDPHVLREVKHDSEYIRSNLLAEMAALAAGGSIQTARISLGGEPAFGLLRPPGHHASRGTYWGFCYYNNVCISLLDLLADKKIESAFILDFDLHEGDGNINILGHRKGIAIHNPRGHGDEAYLADVKRSLDASPDVDIIAASAGFDQYEKCWGSNLTTEAFGKIGQLMFEFAEQNCDGRRYAILEGGYNHEDLGKNIHAFCEGLMGE